jgi:hypothetical protein
VWRPDQGAFDVRFAPDSSAQADIVGRPRLGQKPTLLVVHKRPLRRDAAALHIDERWSG